MVRKTNRSIEKNTEFASDPVSDRELLDKVTDGDHNAGREFYDKYHRLGNAAARRVVRRSRNGNNGVVDFEDLSQEAMVHMLRQIPNYGADKDATFATYASSYLDENISRTQFNSEHGVHISENAREMLVRIDQENDRRINSGRHYLTDEDIAKMLNIPISPSEANPSRISVLDLHNARGMSKFIGSIDEEGFAPGQDETPGSGYDVSEVHPMRSATGEAPVTIEDEASANQLRVRMDEVLDTLGERERDIVKLYYGYDDKTPKDEEEIGEVMGITRERARQILSKAHSKLRHSSRSGKLRDFIDD